MIRNATRDDLGEILKIYAIARCMMQATGNPDQWGNDRPKYDAIVKDIENDDMYVIEENNEILGVFSLIDFDNDYIDIQGEWLNDDPYLAIHKIASSGKKGGIFSQVLEFAKTKTKNIRIDTHKHNKIMQLHIKKNGFQYVGIVYIDGELERLAYHLVLD
ncbi:hypothetical protein [Helcococcus kunzii]|uniref:hypothetical protein n=1 Tax=Helcococcus kunzii TaxID=40091 RepID=UPI0024ACEF08|nr:hypothetical protein [Helcococcus kunzii]